MRTSHAILPDESAPSIAVGTLAAWPLLPARAVRPTRWMYLPRTFISAKQSSSPYNLQHGYISRVAGGSELQHLAMTTHTHTHIYIYIYIYIYTHPKPNHIKPPNLLQAQANARHKESHWDSPCPEPRPKISRSCLHGSHCPPRAHHQLACQVLHDAHDAPWCRDVRGYGSVTVSAPQDRDKCSEATASEENRMPDCASCRQRHTKAACHIVIHEVPTEGLEALLCRNPCISLSRRSIARSLLPHKNAQNISCTFDNMLRLRHHVVCGSRRRLFAAAPGRTF